MTSTQLPTYSIRSIFQSACCTLAIMSFAGMLQAGESLDLTKEATQQRFADPKGEPMAWPIEQSAGGSAIAIPTLTPKQQLTSPFALAGMTFDLTDHSPIELLVDFCAGEMVEYKIGQELIRVGLAQSAAAAAGRKPGVPLDTDLPVVIRHWSDKYQIGTMNPDGSSKNMGKPFDLEPQKNYRLTVRFLPKGDSAWRIEGSVVELDSSGSPGAIVDEFKGGGTFPELSNTKDAVVYIAAGKSQTGLAGVLALSVEQQKN